MAQPSSIQNFETLRRTVRSGSLTPVYALYGGEGYFIDALVEEFGKIVPQEDKQFNEFVFYAPQTDIPRIVDQCRQVPMMSDRQLVIVKECQNARADLLDKLRSYVLSPSPSTVLVLCWRGGEIKGAELKKALAKNPTVTLFESRKLYESNMGPLIAARLKEKELNIDPKAMEMLVEFIGTDVSLLYNEIDKLATILPPRATVTPEAVERNVGVNREYNVFELTDAIAARNAAKAFRIAAYFADNQKAAPWVMVTAAVFNYFANLMVVWYSADRSEAGIQKVLGLKTSFQARNYKTGLANYPPFAVVDIISSIRTYDVRSKGVGSRQDAAALFHDLLYRILTTDGSPARMG